MKFKKLNEDTFGGAVERDAQQLNATPAAVGAKGDVEQALDRALKTNQRMLKRGRREFMNILLVGGAGVGKTSRVRAWCQENGLNMYALDCKTLDTTDLGGAIYPVMDDDGKNGKAVKLVTSMLDQLDKPNSVLFLDEYNRARSDVRGTLLTLVNDHVLTTPGVEGGERFFPNMLFTIAAINPPNAAFQNVDELDPAEQSRFFQVNVIADNRNQLRFLEKEYKKEMEIAEEEGDMEEYTEVSGRLKLAQTLLKDRRFSFDGDEEEAEAARDHTAILNPRSLTKALEICDGTKEDLLAVWDSQCNPKKKPMVELILENYTDVEDKANSVFKDSNPFGDEEIGFKKKEPSLWDTISKNLDL